MSRGYKGRLKAIRDERQRLGVKTIPPAEFRKMQVAWRDALAGPVLGTLEDFMSWRRTEGGK